MKRVLIDYKKLSPEVAALLIDTYPYGYGDEDIVTLQKSNGEIIEAVELRTEDSVYMVKISKHFSNFISNFEENIAKELDKELPYSTFIPDNDKKKLYENLGFESDVDLESEGSLY